MYLLVESNKVINVLDNVILELVKESKQVVEIIN